MNRKSWEGECKPFEKGWVMEADVEGSGDIREVGIMQRINHSPEGNLEMENLDDDDMIQIRILSISDSEIIRRNPDFPALPTRTLHSTRCCMSKNSDLLDFICKPANWKMMLAQRFPGR
jgi:hypothetical protein